MRKRIDVTWLVCCLTIGLLLSLLPSCQGGQRTEEPTAQLPVVDTLRLPATGAAASQPTGTATAEGSATQPSEVAQPGSAPADGDEAKVGAAAAKKGGCKSVPRSLPLVEQCQMAGAVVHQFGNTCAGRCGAIERGMMCGQAMTKGCKCPAGQCVDDKSGCCRPLKR